MFSPYLFAVHPVAAGRARSQELSPTTRPIPASSMSATAASARSSISPRIVIAKKYGIKWGIVPYRGGAAAVRAVVSNESNVIFNGALATHAVRRAEPAQGHRGVRRQAAARRCRTCRPSRSSTCRSSRPAPGRASSPARARRPRWRRGSTPRSRKILAMPEISGKIVELGGEVRTGTPERVRRLDRPRRSPSGARW